MCYVIKEYLENEETQIANFSRLYGIHFFLDQTDGTLTIISMSGKWKIVAGEQGKYIELYHVNHRHTRHISAIPGYHLQNVRRSNLIGYMQYIMEHDQYRTENSLYVTQKTANLIRGSKRWKKQQHRAENMRKTNRIRYVTELLNNMAVGNIPY